MNNLLAGLVENWPVDEAVWRTIPLGRRARFEEIAKTAAFLLSPEAGYIIGHNILVDDSLNRGV